MDLNTFILMDVRWTSIESNNYTFKKSNLIHIYFKVLNNYILTPIFCINYILTSKYLKILQICPINIYKLVPAFLNKGKL
jgi:hypothetical protein